MARLDVRRAWLSLGTEHLEVSRQADSVWPCNATAQSSVPTACRPDDRTAQMRDRPHCSDHQPAGHLSFLLDSDGLAEPTSGPTCRSD